MKMLTVEVGIGAGTQLGDGMADCLTFTVKILLCTQQPYTIVTRSTLSSTANLNLESRLNQTLLQLLSSYETKQVAIGSSCNFYLDYIIIISSNHDADCLAIQFL